YEIYFCNCEFTGEVNLSYAKFKRVVNFDDTRFCKPVNFRGAHAALDFYIQGSSVSAGSKFQDFSVEGSLYGRGTNFGALDLANSEARGVIPFDRVRVGKDLSFGPRKNQQGQLVPTRFSSEVSFRDAHIKVNAQFQSVEFLGRANFNRTKI